MELQARGTSMISFVKGKTEVSPELLDLPGPPPYYRKKSGKISR